MSDGLPGKSPTMTVPGESLPEGPDTELEGEDDDDLTVPEPEPEDDPGSGGAPDRAGERGGPSRSG